MLSWIPADCDRTQWIKIGGALRHEFGDVGFDLFDEWSQRSADQYDARDTLSAWRSLKGGTANPATFKTIAGMARDAGWVPSAQARKLTPAESEQRARDRVEREAKSEAEAVARRRVAAERANGALNAARPYTATDAVKNDYLQRHGLDEGYGAMIGTFSTTDQVTGEISIVSEYALLVPIMDMNKRVRSVQAIFPDAENPLKRDKTYLAGGDKRGHFFRIGQPKIRNGKHVVLVAEGFATAASLHKATGHCVFVAFDAGNLKPVAEVIHDKVPAATIVLCADNDRFTAGNPGRTRAHQAAAAVGGLVALPEFDDDKTAGTDFNDLAMLHGMHDDEAVAAVIEAVLKANVVITQADVDAEWVRGKVEKVTAVVVEHDPLAGVVDGDVDHVFDEQAPSSRVPGSDDESAVGVGQPARDIAKAIASRLADAIGIDPADERLGINLMAIDRMVNGSFWSGSKSKAFLLNESQSLNQYLGGDAYKFLVRAFGEPMDGKAIAEMTEQFIADHELTKSQAKTLRSLTAGVAGTVIIDHLKYHNQRDKVEWRCDMFARNARMHLLEDKARIVLAHKPFEVRGTYEPEIVDDYKQHFTRFDEFLQFLVQSRFALDRKKCYLWILADSDWGKGFLLGVLSELSLAVSTSMTEIEAMFDGRPVGRAPEEFKRAFALVVDEFKSVKSELKQLQSKITLSPKNQLTSEVEIFAKLFLSAESVASLVTSHGVEDQFANRMSVFQETGTLVQRPLYLEVGNPRYFASVLNYAAETMNRMVAEMQSLGLEESQTGAERWINGFIGRYGLDTLHDRFSDSLPDVAADALAWLYKQPHLLLQEGGGEHSRYYLQSANKVLDTYLNEHFDVSEVQTYRRRKPEILRLLSTDGKGVMTRKPNGKHTKCVALMRVGSSGEDLGARKDEDSEQF